MKKKSDGSVNLIDFPFEHPEETYFDGKFSKWRNCTIGLTNTYYTCTLLSAYFVSSFIAVSALNPRFSQRYYYIELSDEYKPGSPLAYNSTTYPGGKECPCGDFEYMITDVQNAMEDTEGAVNDAVFAVDK